MQLPDVAMPRAVSKAVALLHEREADVLSARKAVEQAQQVIPLALGEDRALLADALDAGRADPGTPREDEARSQLAEAERLLAAEEVRLSRARQALDEALSAAQGWEAKVEQAVKEAELAETNALRQLLDVEHERARLRVALAWLHAYRQGEKLPNLEQVPQTRSALLRNPQASPHERYTVDELIAAIGGGIEVVRLEAEAARSVEREANAGQPPVLHSATG